MWYNQIPRTTESWWNNLTYIACLYQHILNQDFKILLEILKYDIETTYNWHCQVVLSALNASEPLKHDIPEWTLSKKWTISATGNWYFQGGYWSHSAKMVIHDSAQCQKALHSSKMLPFLHVGLFVVIAILAFIYCNASTISLLCPQTDWKKHNLFWCIRKISFRQTKLQTD